MRVGNYIIPDPENDLLIFKFAITKLQLITSKIPLLFLKRQGIRKNVDKEYNDFDFMGEREIHDEEEGIIYLYLYFVRYGKYYYKAREKGK